MKVLKKGTQIICPECELLICEPLVDIKSGDVIKIKKFKFHSHQAVTGEYTHCPLCQGIYGDRGKFYTKEHGWF